MRHFPLFSRYSTCTDDTVMTLAVVKGFYGVPEELKQECRNRLPENLLEVLLQFDAR